MAYKKETRDKMLLVQKFKSWDGVLKRVGLENALSKTHSYQAVRFRKEGYRATPGDLFRRDDYWQIEKVKSET